MRLFVSYRRGDSPFVAGRLKDRMVDAFGEDNVFYDVDSIGPGVDFRLAIGQRVHEADAMLAVIGPDWDPTRLHSETDYVRIELEQALASGKRLIPILIEPTQMPSAEQLPASLERLPFLNALPLRPDPDFDTDVQRLLDGLTNSHHREHTGTHRRSTGTRARVLIGGVIAAVCVLLVVIVVIALNNHGSGTSTVGTIGTTPVWTGDPLRSELDANRWSISAGSTVTVDSSSDGVIIDVSSSAAKGAQGWIRTTCRFAADFVVSVAYDTLRWDPPAGHRLGLLAMVDDTKMLALERFSDGSPDRYSIDFGQGGRFTPAKERPLAAGTTGELRLSRQSGHYTAQFRDNDQADWRDVGAGGDGFIQPVSIGISVWSAASGSDRAARFHDFHVESGTCVS